MLLTARSPFLKSHPEGIDQIPESKLTKNYLFDTFENIIFGPNDQH
jgi:hypothetical protein